MSRIGKAPIKLPSNVEVKVENGLVTVKGPLGQLTQDFDSANIGIKVEDGQIIVSRFNEINTTRAKHGLYRALVYAMVVLISLNLDTII